MSRVEITQVAFQTLAVLGRYMAVYIGHSSAVGELEKLIDDSCARLADNPAQYPVCSELASLGIHDYQQITFKKYKVLFRNAIETQTVYITAFMRHRQSAQKLLVDYTLLP
ncbi:type II toxin-antitoxin system RelE/ParE family toxin [Lacimicrobium alkaliphilum]|uniref:Plasmid stabilization protein n=1 Tax=Lacimicrobium alkaliphilum TaxID=1526571 RepID=A0ABQ1R461_9ALTE|nr:type II toxin-antitoxin system RelE/ParE family toxin [Lacimicrobium alkaliphilum]GGD57326.1 hypothetical protein GCM10011357_10990 [Lacimicrobium alkaliphilum]